MAKKHLEASRTPKIMEKKNDLLGRTEPSLNSFGYSTIEGKIKAKHFEVSQLGGYTFPQAWPANLCAKNVTIM